MTKHKSNFGRKIENLEAAKLLAIQLLGKPACREKHHAELRTLKDTLYNRNLTENDFFKAKARLNELKALFLDQAAQNPFSSVNSPLPPDSLHDLMSLEDRAKAAWELADKIYKEAPDLHWQGAELVRIKDSLRKFYTTGLVPEQEVSKILSRLEQLKSLLPPSAFAPKQPVAPATPAYSGRTPEKAKQYVKSMIYDLLHDKSGSHYLSFNYGELQLLDKKIAKDKSGENKMSDAEWKEAEALIDRIKKKLGG